MKIYLIRHGDPDYEHDTLTPRGHSESEALAGYLAQERLDALFSSPLGRAQATASYTARAVGLPVTIELWTAELGGRCLDPSHYSAWNVHGHDVRTVEYLARQEDYGRLATLDAAMVRQMEATVRKNSDAFLARLGYVRQDGVYRTTTTTPFRRLALFCHGGFGLTWLSVLLELPLPLVWTGFFLPTSSVTQILFEERTPGIATPRCLTLGAVPHLNRANQPPNTAGLMGNHD